MKSALEKMCHPFLLHASRHEYDMFQANPSTFDTLNARLKQACFDESIYIETRARHLKLSPTCVKSLRELLLVHSSA